MSTPANALDITQSGLVKFDGSTTFTGVTVTNHDVLLGSTSNGITSVAPSATTGVALVSQGAAADPAFGTVVVAGGGTGAATLTGVLIGHGTSAVTAQAITQHDILVAGASNAITSIATGSAGDVMISGGAASDPAFITPTAGTGLSVTKNASTLSWALSTPVAIANGGTNATSMSTNTGIVKYDGSKLVTSTTAKIDSSNRQTNSSQPCLFAYLNTTLTNATGDSTPVSTVIFDTVNKDQNSNYSNVTGLFTAPVTGSYLVSSTILLGNLGVLHTFAEMRFTNHTALGDQISYIVNPYACSTTYNATSGCYSMTLSGIVLLTANDTFGIKVVVANGTKSVSIMGAVFGTESSLSISLLC